MSRVFFFIIQISNYTIVGKAIFTIWLKAYVLWSRSFCVVGYRADPLGHAPLVTPPWLADSSRSIVIDGVMGVTRAHFVVGTFLRTSDIVDWPPRVTRENHSDGDKTPRVIL